jgi:predicted O-methyltransferase YrrM
MGAVRAAPEPYVPHRDPIISRVIRRAGPHIGRSRHALVQRLRPVGQRAYYRHRAVRWLHFALVGIRERFRGGYPLAHLAAHAEEHAIGPVQRDEALLLFAVTRVLRPQVVVEVGFLGGQSAFNFLRALDPGATLYSFDISQSAEDIAAAMFSHFDNFHFRRVSQDAIGPEHIGGQRIDLVFLDASHDVKLNQRTFDRLAPMLQDDGVLIVHDTGAWPREHLTDRHRAVAMGRPELWTAGDLFEHRREEREFVNWILEERPGFAQLHLHSRHTLRHGLTILQRRGTLATGAIGARTRARED